MFNYEFVTVPYYSHVSLILLKMANNIHFAHKYYTRMKVSIYPHPQPPSPHTVYTLPRKIFKLYKLRINNFVNKVIAIANEEESKSGLHQL